MRLQGKIALITGGGTGIGRAIAQRFSSEGAFVAVAGRRMERLDETVGTFENSGLAIQADVVNPEDVEAMVNRVVQEWGRLDILVNNAATISSRTALLDTPVADWDFMHDVNVRGVFLTCKATLPHMLAHGGGTIINIASVSGQRGQPGNAPYSTTKGAIMNLTRSIAVDYGKHQVRCNSISPALVRTEMAETRLKPGEDWEKRAAKEWIPNYPLGRIGKPEDVANGALFLASNEASWITGIDLIIDGGKMAGL